MLSFDQIMPAINSLAELYSRPKTNAKVASQNQKIALVLKKKIAQGVLDSLANKDRSLTPSDIRKLQTEFLDKMSHPILHMTLIASVGIDFSDLDTNVLKKIRGEDKKKKMQLFLTTISNEKVPTEGETLLSIFFEGTEFQSEEIGKQKAEFRKLYKDSYMALRNSLKYLIKNIQKEIEKSKKTGDLVDGTLTSEFITTLLIDSLTGREDASDDEDIFKITGLRKKMSSKSVFKIIYDEAMKFRKSYAKSSASQDVKGTGNFTWAKKSRKIIGCMRNFNYKMWRIVSKELKKGFSTSFGDLGFGEETYQEIQDRLVADSLADLISTMQGKETLNQDTQERRATLVEARNDYKDEDSQDNLMEYMLRVLDLIKNKVQSIPTETDCRLLLDNIELISEGNQSVYKKIRGLVYDRLFRVGQLTNAEIQLLDGVYSESDLWKEKQKIGDIFDMSNFVKYFEDDFGLDAIESSIGLNETITSLTEDTVNFTDFLSGLKDILKYAPSNLHLKNHVATYEYLSETLDLQDQVLKKIGLWLSEFDENEDLKDDLIAALSSEEQTTIVNDIGYLIALLEEAEISRKEIIKLLSLKNAHKPTEDDEWSGGIKVEGSHPLMSYSIHEYPLTLKSLDAGRSLSNVSPHATISTVDLRVFQELKDSLSEDASFKQEASKLNKQRNLVNKLVDNFGEAIGFVSKAQIKTMMKEVKDGERDVEEVNKVNANNASLEASLNRFFRSQGPIEKEFEDFFGKSKDQTEIFDSIRKLLTPPNATKPYGVAVKEVIRTIQKVYDEDYSKKMKDLFEDYMDGAISVVLQEVLNQETSERDRKGTNVLKHRAKTDRVKRFLQRDVPMVLLQEETRESLVKKGNKPKQKQQQIDSAKKVLERFNTASDQEGYDFDGLLNEVALQKNKNGEVIFKDSSDVSKLRKLIKALVKKEQGKTVEEYIKKAKGMKEGEAQEKVDELNSKLNTAISGFNESTRGSILLSQLNKHLSQGFINKTKKATTALIDFGKDQIKQVEVAIDKQLTALDITPEELIAQAQQEGISKKELSEEIKGSKDRLKEKKKNLITIKSFKKLLADLREVSIIGSIYNFEDRLGDRLKEKTTQEIEKIKSDRDAKIKELKKKKKEENITDEEASELRLIEEGEDDTFGSKLRKKYNYQRHGIAEAKANEVEARGLNRSFVPYAPAVEQKEEAIREKARAMVNLAVDENVSFDELGLGSTYQSDNLRTLPNGKGGFKGVLGVADLKGVASRTRSLRKHTMLRKKYAESNKFEKLLQADVDLRPLANVISASPECFPSVDLSLDYGLLKVYLAMPYYPTNVLVQKSGEFYALRSSNVFADPLSERNIQALMRYLLASSNPFVISHGGDEFGFMGQEEAPTNPKLVEFYKNFVNSPSAGAFKELADDYKKLMGDLEIDQNSALRKQYLGLYEEQLEWWQDNYTAQQMIEAYGSLKQGDKTPELDEMIRVVLGIEDEEQLEEREYEEFKQVAHMVQYKDKVNKAEEEFYNTQNTYGHSISQLLGSGLGSFITPSEEKALSKELMESKNKNLISNDILGEKYNSRITGRVILNFTGLIADLNVLLACASSVVSLREMNELEIDPDCVEKVREIFGADIEELNEIVRKR